MAHAARGVAIDYELSTIDWILSGAHWRRGPEGEKHFEFRNSNFELSCRCHFRQRRRAGGIPPAYSIIGRHGEAAAALDIRSRALVVDRGGDLCVGHRCGSGGNRCSGEPAVSLTPPPWPSPVAGSGNRGGKPGAEQLPVPSSGEHFRERRRVRVEVLVTRRLLPPQSTRSTS